MANYCTFGAPVFVHWHTENVHSYNVKALVCAAKLLWKCFHVEKVHNQTWSSPVTFASPWKGIVGGASSQSRSLTSASSVIVNSQDTLEWPPIGK